MRVAVVQGGPSTEAEVSRASAASVARALTEVGHDVVRLELDARLAEAIRTGAFDVVFPVVHGAVGEDGSLQGLLEVLGAAYVGSGVVASAVAMHKRLARRIFAAAGLPIAKGIELDRGDARAAAERARREVGERLVVKPSASGSAIGVSRIDSGEPLDAVARALEGVWELDEVAVVEHFAKGREVTCGVLELEREAQALPPTEILSPSDPFYTYEARYAPGRSVHECPAKLAAEVTARVQQVAIAAHRVLGCRDLSRVDFIVGDTDVNPGAGDDGDPAAVTLLEVNTLPGFTDTSLFPEAAAVKGVRMPQLCDALVTRAFTRGPTRRNAAKPLPR
jgi:D-alanine-D-alanine ligase